MLIAVAGGTGLVGRLVVEAVRADGHEVSVVARSTGADLTTGRGLAAALDGADAVIDVSNVTTTSRRRAVRFFESATGNLLREAAAAGVKHLVVLSIVGCDRVDLGYYFGKRRQEELVRTGPVPSTVLRATQFHEFAAQMVDRGGPFVLAPKMRSRPIAAREVARALVDLAVAGPVGPAPDLAGPQEQEMSEMIRRLLRTRRSRRIVVPLRLPGAVGGRLTGGGLLPTGPGPRGTETFDQWLARTEGSR